MCILLLIPSQPRFGMECVRLVVAKRFENRKRQKYEPDCVAKHEVDCMSICYGHGVAHS